MGYTLKPRNKEIEEVDYGASFWPILLEQSCAGYVIGYGSTRQPAAYVYLSGNNGSPVSNDGYKVSAVEARAMAMVARGYVSVHRYINKEWDDISYRDKADEQVLLPSGKPLYKEGVNDKMLDEIERFAEFAEKSKGFSIH